jgi:hypothetical protein
VNDNIVDPESRRKVHRVPNGAREAMMESLRVMVVPAPGFDDFAYWTDMLLAELWLRGFVVVPHGAVLRSSKDLEPPESS